MHLIAIFFIAVVLFSVESDGRKLGRFYATTPIPDKNLESFPSPWAVDIDSSTLPWLSLLPTWNTTMRKINGTVVTPHVDSISAVRAIGGWTPKYGHCNATCDIVYRDKGQLAYRFELLDQRLDHFIWHYQLSSVLLVLDNVPYCLVATPVLGPFGQDAPPDNMTEWRAFVKATVEHLIARYGRSVVEQRIRLRVGTEPDGPRWSQCPGGKAPCSTTPYFEAYVTASMAAKSVLPSVKVGAGNWLYPSDTTSYFETDFYARVATLEKKHSSLPRLIDFIGISDYVSGSATHGLRLPQKIAAGVAAMKNFSRIYSATNGHASVTDFEIMEFAPLTNIDHRTSVEPGSFGAAFYVAMFATAASNGAGRVFHWGTNHEAPRGAPLSSGSLWTALGWTMGVLDWIFAGGTQVDVEIGVPAGLTRGVYKFVSENATVATAFDPNRQATFQPLRFTLDHDVDAVVMINDMNSPFDVMLREAEVLGYTKYNDNLPYSITTLLNAAGQKWIRTPSVWAKFMALQRESFTPKKESLKKGDSYALPPFTTVLLRKTSNNE